MPSLKTSVLATATMLLSSVRADYVIDPESVSLTMRNSWCQQEKSTCPIICQQVEPRTTEENDCDPATLTYACLCGDGLQPNMSEYSLTLPYFTCMEWGNQCVTDCNGDNECARSCREDHPCGAKDPSPANKTSATASSSQASATASATDDSGRVYDGLDGEDGADSAAIRALENGQFGGFLLLVAGVCAGVGIML